MLGILNVIELLARLAVRGLVTLLLALLALIVLALSCGAQDPVIDDIGCPCPTCEPYTAERGESHEAVTPTRE